MHPLRLGALALAILPVFAAPRLGAQTHFALDTFALRAGERYDVDTGAVLRRDAATLRAELHVDGGEVRATVPTSPGDDLAAVLPPASDGWQKLATDRGRIAWFEVLRRGDGVLVGRVLVRTDGDDAPTPPPPGLDARAHDDGVELVWERDGAARWRVEMAGADGTFAAIGTVTDARIVEPWPAVGSRARYRVTRVDASGSGGISATIVVARPSADRAPLSFDSTTFRQPGGGAAAIDLATGARGPDTAHADLRVAGGRLLDAHGVPPVALRGGAFRDAWQAWSSGPPAGPEDTWLCPIDDGAFAIGRTTQPLPGQVVLRWIVVPTGTHLPLAGLVDVGARGPAGSEPGQPMQPDAVPDRAVQEWLFSRQRHDDYEAATFSFEHGIRDDPELRVTRNDWDLQFGNGSDRFHVRMVTDDCSQIGRLHARSWEELTPDVLDTLLLGAESPALQGGFYAVRTLDTETELCALFRVDVLLPGDACHLSWVARHRDGRIDHSADVSDADVAKAGAVLARLAATASMRAMALDDASRATLHVLERGAFRAEPGPSVGAILDAVSAATGALQVAAADRAALDAIRPSAALWVEDAQSLEAALEAVLRRHGWRWWITPRGEVALAPRRA